MKGVIAVKLSVFENRDKEILAVYGDSPLVLILTRPHTTLNAVGSIRTYGHFIKMIEYRGELVNIITEAEIPRLFEGELIAV